MIIRRDLRSIAGVGAAVLGLLFSSSSGAQERAPAAHTVFLTGIEVKGATTADKLAAPSVDPKVLSKGYGFKGPGEADKKAPEKWEVSAYIFSPSFVTVRQGDRVRLYVFLVNGDDHEVFVTAPDGSTPVVKRTWNRGREYQVEFAAEEIGTYQLTCSTHAPTMTTTFFVMPR
jgi:plastocyanin